VANFTCVPFKQVLRKADMIRKNAVESILAERDILITVRNPFVVSEHANLEPDFKSYSSKIVLLLAGTLFLFVYLPG
jgi:hypothetical protein